MVSSFATEAGRAEILSALERLVAVVADLRHPETGCPWDLEQTAESLIPYVIEEAYEVVDAIRLSSRPRWPVMPGSLTWRRWPTALPIS